MEYFGYKPKDLDKSYIDWSGITKGISDEITSTLVNRQQEREKLEKDHFDRLKKLNEFNLSVDPSASSSILKGVQNARDYLMSNHRLMKSGTISVDEAKRRSQNLMDSWTFLSKGMETYVAGAEKRAEAEGKLNDAYNEIIPGYFDLASSGQVPEPGSGEGYTVPYNPDGTLNMDKALPNRAMLTLGGQIADYVDVEAATTAIADDAKSGVWKRVFSSGLSIKDARANPNYKSWITNTVNSNLNTDEKLASVLLDYKNMEYTTTNEPGKIQVEFDKKTGKIIPVLTEFQREDARHEFRHAIEAKIGSEREEPKAEDPTDEMIITGLINDFISTGDFSNLANVLTKKGYTGANMSNDVLSITLPDGVKRSAKLKPGMSGKEVGQNIASLFGLTQYKSITGEQEFEANPGVFDIGTYKPITTGGTPEPGKIDRTALNNLTRALVKDPDTNEEVNPLEVLQYSQLIAKSLDVDEKLIMIDPTGTVLINGVSAGNIKDGTASSADIASRIEDIANKPKVDDWTGIDPTKF